MTSARQIRLTGVAMTVAAALALLLNIQMLSIGRGDPVVTSFLVLTFGVAVFIVGEMRGESS